jgi:two-component system cell cycle sensor histidine kinase/response regulator CckA
MRIPIMGLKKLGYNVVHEIESAEAVRNFLNDPRKFDLVITKLSMPEISGVEIGKKIVSTRLYLPLLLCLEPHEKLDNDIAKKTGIVKLLHKPLNLRQLTQTIREIFGTSQYGI